MEKNTPQLWDKLWNDNKSIEEDIYNLTVEEHGIRWRRIEEIVLKEFRTFNGLKVIEIGAGAGTNSALMAKRGANVAVLDYSKNAINQSRIFFERNRLKADFIEQDALSLTNNLLNQYDISMSFGLTEHFQGHERLLINKAHFDVLKKGGIAFISVPNRWNPPYRIYKFLAEATGRWTVGEEYPYDRGEFKKICKDINGIEYCFIGDSFISSFHFLNPIINKILKKTSKKNSIETIQDEKGTFLDEYFSYALVLCGKKV